MGERLVFEVADRQLDLGVLAVLGIDRVHVLLPVGEEGKVAPVGKELGLRAVDAADDEPAAAVGGLGEFADARLGVVGDPAKRASALRRFEALKIKGRVLLPASRASLLRGPGRQLVLRVCLNQDPPTCRKCGSLLEGRQRQWCARGLS